MMKATLPTVREKFERWGQGDVFKWIDKCSALEREQLCDQLQGIDLEDLMKKYQAAKSTVWSKEGTSVQPVRASVKIAEASEEDRKRWERLGFQNIAKGKVAALVVAGGQGTRFGSPEPKGTVDIGLLSHKSLFQLQAERLLKLQQLAAKQAGEAVPIRWYVMTSVDTDDKTQAFFKDNNYFGLNEENIVFFMQGLLPCLTKEGKIMMESACQVAMAPDGNGGLYQALERWGVLQDMRNYGVDYLFQYCVDNILIKMLDPVFIGFLYESDADLGCKVAPKVSPTEPVGVLCLRDSKNGVIEYSEIDKDLAAKRDASGELVFNAAHLCMNTYRIDFLENVARNYAKALPYHIAFKKIPCADDEGVTRAADAPNGYKLEQFIFDVFQYAKNLVAFEIVREEEFSPLKNAPGAGKDCPETCARICTGCTASIFQGRAARWSTSSLLAQRWRFHLWSRTQVKASKRWWRRRQANSSRLLFCLGEQN